MSYLASLNPQTPQAEKPDNHLTSDTFPAIVARLVKAGMYKNVASLIGGQKDKPEMMATVKPRWVQLTAGGLAAKGQWGSFAQLACAVQAQPRLMAKIEPFHVKAAAAYMLAPDSDGGNAKAFGHHGMVAYTDLLQAAAAYPKLVAVFSAEDVAQVAKAFIEHSSHSYDRNFSFGRQEKDHVPNVHTVYYPDKAEYFVRLAEVVKNNTALNVAIDPADIKTAALVLFKSAEEKVREHETDQHYPVELPRGFKGFNQLTRFLQNLNDAPQNWKDGLAGFVEERMKGSDDRCGIYIAGMVKKAPYLMGPAEFNKMIESTNGNSHALEYVIHSFGTVDHLRPEYPAAIRLMARAGFKDWEHFRVNTEVFPQFAEDVAGVASDMMCEMDEAGDYGRMARLAGELIGERLHAVKDEFLATRGLHIVRFFSGWTGDQKTYDKAFAEEMGRRSMLDIIFRKATGDAVVCVDADEQSYRAGQRKPRIVVAPVKGADDYASAPEGLAPAIGMAFAKAAKAAENTPEWVKGIIKNINGAPAGPTAQ